MKYKFCSNRINVTKYGYRYTWSKNDVVSSVRKHNCALGLGLGLVLGVVLVLVLGLELRGGVSVNTFSIKRVFDQV